MSIPQPSLGGGGNNNAINANNNNNQPAADNGQVGAQRAPAPGNRNVRFNPAPAQDAPARVNGAPNEQQQRIDHLRDDRNNAGGTNPTAVNVDGAVENNLRRQRFSPGEARQLMNSEQVPNELITEQTRIWGSLDDRESDIVGKTITANLTLMEINQEPLASVDGFVQYLNEHNVTDDVPNMVTAVRSYIEHIRQASENNNANNTNDLVLDPAAGNNNANNSLIAALQKLFPSSTPEINDDACGEFATIENASVGEFVTLIKSGTISRGDGEGNSWYAVGQYKRYKDRT